MGGVYKEEKVKENFKTESLLDIYRNILFKFLIPLQIYYLRYPIISNKLNTQVISAF